jgi:hypothetical protein
MQIHDQFESIDAARQAIRAFVLDNGESFKVVAFDKKRYIISVGITAARTVKPCQADRSGNYGQPELSFS